MERRELRVKRRAGLPASRSAAGPLVAIARHALPTVTASLAVAATVLTAERAVRILAERITGTVGRRGKTASNDSNRTVITEWLAIERTRRSR